LRGVVEELFRRPDFGGFLRNSTFAGNPALRLVLKPIFSRFA
jgi:hypothetical protein